MSITGKKRFYESILSYAVAWAFLYLSVFLSEHIKYDENFISVIPVLFPFIFAMAFIGISVLFIFDKEYPWLFRTGIMSLAIGVTLFIFGIIAFYYGVESLLWGGSIGIGVLFTAAGIVRLIIQGGFSAYRKAKN
ncbi:MAG: hypothetical protein ACP5LF_05670 [Nitrososphaeria archaeon]